jgi:hypothetical protein
VKILKQLEDCGRSCAVDFDAIAELRADARALWSVRVLDAWTDANSCDPFKTQKLGGREWFCTSNYPRGAHGLGRFVGSSADAARHAAAQAVYTTLPADARADLGERP